MKRYFPALCLVVFVASILVGSGCAAHKSNHSGNGVHNPSSNTVQPIPVSMAEEAYIFSYPMLENYKTMYVQIKQNIVPGFNTFVHATKLLTSADTTVVRPNNDTMYSIAWLDLRDGPIVLTVPEITERYYSFQMIDMYTYNFAYVGTRATGTAAGSYLIAREDWCGEPPPNVTKVFYTAGNFVYVVGRTGVLEQTPDDMNKIAAIQTQYKIQPLSVFLGGQPPPPRTINEMPPYVKTTQSADFIGIFNFLLGQVAVYADDADLIANWETIGVGAGLPFDRASLPKDEQDWLDAGAAAGYAAIAQKSNALGQVKNDWYLLGRVFGNRAVIGQQFLVRAAAAYAGLYGNDLDEAYYPSTNMDSTATRFGTSDCYKITFTAAQIPDVQAMGFWSITMYNQQQFLAENTYDPDNPGIGRYSIGDRTADMKIGDDGSLEIYIQADMSKNDDRWTNWLPSPQPAAGTSDIFTITMRMYLPHDLTENDLYAPPAVQKIDCTTK